MTKNRPFDDILLQVPGTVVIDRRLLDGGRCWVRLAAPYSDSLSGAPGYADVVPLAQDLIRRAPDRMLWASNWPYVDVMEGPKPLPSDMLDLLAVWAPDEATRHRILVENPEKIYDFDPTSRPKRIVGQG